MIAVKRGTRSALGSCAFCLSTDEKVVEVAITVGIGTQSSPIATFRLCQEHVPLFVAAMHKAEVRLEAALIWMEDLAGQER